MKDAQKRPIIIDTHCHVQMAQYDADRDEVIKRALDGGIEMICVGVDLETSKSAIELAHQYEGVYASVGLHPNDNLEEVYEQSSYTELAKDLKVVAIGEIGLDHYRTTDPAMRAVQKKRFIEQLQLVQESNKPVIIHCRDAHEDMLSILPPGRGVIHSFTGTIKEALEYVKRGYHIGFNGIITFAHQYDEVVRALSLERILLETDSPYLAPKSHRGKRNEPAYVVETAMIIANLRGISEEEVLSTTEMSARSLFIKA